MTTIDEDFALLSERWKRETRFLSSGGEEHPAYQAIIAMGPPALPLILTSLRERAAHWFLALATIAGEDHAVGEDTVEGARQKWLAWGVAEGYITDAAAEREVKLAEIVEYSSRINGREEEAKMRYMVSALSSDQLPKSSEDVTPTPEETTAEDPFARFPEPHRARLLAYEPSTSYDDGSWFKEYAATLKLQPVIEATTFEALPDEIERKCCQFKSCGNTNLYKAVGAQINRRTHEATTIYGYRRYSNDDWFYGAATIEELVDFLNDPLDFPVVEED